MMYNEISEQQRERIEQAASQELKRILRAEGRKAHITIDKVIRALNRYKVRGRVFVDGDTGFLGEDHHPWFHVLLEAQGGPDGPLNTLEVFVSKPPAART